MDEDIYILIPVYSMFYYLIDEAVVIEISAAYEMLDWI